ncbi:glycosyltransferase family 4 protein [Sulfitobacter marinus]|uniref:glycosyltransferase family 4 protein n=1 Tax=Sulfitobacter marinus TaxID=394264 RepID=UPI00318423F8
MENLPVPLDRRVWLEATTLQNAGYEVSVICPMGRGWDQEYEQIEGVHIYRYPQPFEAHSGIFAYAREYGHALWHWFKLAETIWERRPFDAIQGCNPPDLVFLLARWYRKRGVRYVFDHHDVSPELFEAKFGRRGLLYYLIRLLERMTFNTADVAIATNDSFRAIAIARGRMYPSDVFTVRSAPKTDTFLPATGDQSYRKGAATLIGYVGVIGQQEGMDLLVRAADYLVNKARANVHFLIIGFGPAHRDMIRDVARRRLEDRFTFAGPLYDRALVDALNAIDIGVAPDPKNPMNDVSTMNKVMEYMTLEKPVVQFDLTEGRVSAGPASLYAKPNDPIDFALKIEVLIDKTSMRWDMGWLGRKRVLDQLSWAHSVPNLLAAYARLFEKRP